MKGIEDYKNSMKYPLTIYRGAEKKKGILSIQPPDFIKLEQKILGRIYSILPVPKGGLQGS